MLYFVLIKMQDNEGLSRSNDFYMLIPNMLQNYESTGDPIVIAI